MKKVLVFYVQNLVFFKIMQFHPWFKLRYNSFAVHRHSGSSSRGCIKYRVGNNRFAKRLVSFFANESSSCQWMSSACLLRDCVLMSAFGLSVKLLNTMDEAKSSHTHTQCFCWQVNLYIDTSINIL